MNVETTEKTLTLEKINLEGDYSDYVLVPKEKYLEMIDEINDYALLCMAVERLEHYDPSTLISEEEMDRRLGITQEELDSIGEVEIE